MRWPPLSSRSTNPSRRTTSSTVKAVPPAGKACGFPGFWFCGSRRPPRNLIGTLNSELSTLERNSKFEEGRNAYDNPQSFSRTAAQAPMRRKTRCPPLRWPPARARTALSWTCTCPKTASWWSSTTKRWDRTTNGTGAVKDRTLAELQALCGRQRHVRLCRRAHPTLREVLELVRPTGMLVNIELKTSLVWYDGIEGKDARACRGARHAGARHLFFVQPLQHRALVGASWPRRRRRPISLPISSAMWKSTPPPTAWAGCTRGCGTSGWRISCTPTSPAGWPCACGRE